MKIRPFTTTSHFFVTAKCNQLAGKTDFFQIKNYILPLLFSLLVLPGIAQENDEIKTLFGEGMSFGGYGGLQFGYTEIDGIEAVTAGGRAAWIIGHGLAVGFSGKGYMNNFLEYMPGKQMNLAGGYGGFLVEPILLPKFPVHLSFPVLLGAGGIAYTTSLNDRWDEQWRTNVMDTDAFLIVEPGAELEFNLTRIFRLSLGAYYRFTSDVILDDIPLGGPTVPNNVMDGLSVGLNLKFGKF